MRKTIVSLIFILVSTFIIDRIGGMAMWWVNQNTHDVSGPKIKYLVYDVHEDVVLMGTSRCNLHYVPSIISDSIGMSVYNGGIDASNNIYSHYIMLSHILAHHTPKIICLDLVPNDYAKELDPFGRVSFFAPYIGKNKQADSVFHDAGKYWFYEISHLYRYNAKAISNIAGLVIDKYAHSENGYIPQPRPRQQPKLYENNNVYEVDSVKLKYLNRYIALCHQHGIKLVFTVSPAYIIASQEQYSVLAQISEDNNIPMFDYHSEGLFIDHPEYFKDNEHLWDKGARLYSAVFASDLKSILKAEEY